MDSFYPFFGGEGGRSWQEGAGVRLLFFFLRGGGMVTIEIKGVLLANVLFFFFPLPHTHTKNNKL